MKIERIYANPSKHTFTITPIKNLIRKYVKDGKGWVDPFAGENSPAGITNDLNPNKPTKYHLPAVDFCKQLKGRFIGILFDPPYSPRQIKECYEGIGLEVHQEDTQSSFYGNVKNSICDKILPNGFVISCGWNSNGFGKNRGFKIVEILIVPHGSNRNDTIVTVEKKINNELGQY